MAQPDQTFQRLLKGIALWTSGVVATLLLTALLVATSQDGSIQVLQRIIQWQSGVAPNSFSPRGPVNDRVFADGTRARMNLRYGSTYPNSYVDIWYPTSDDRVKRPTVVWIHGGGWFTGTKETGDPFAGQGPGHAAEPVHSLVQAGFNVVNLDYALAPEYRYPVPIVQLNDALAYLASRGEHLGLDMHNVVIMGGSAGAQMSAQYGALLSDPAYGAEVGIMPAVALSDVKGIGIWSAPLKTSGFGWRMNAIWWSYLNTKDLVDSSQARQMNILAHINEHYPSTYITDGNQSDTFPEHAKAMVRILREKKVDHVFNYYDASEAKLDHTYTGQADSRYGRDNINKTIAFIRQRTTAPMAGGR